jgi:hypothetical protein
MSAKRLLGVLVPVVFLASSVLAQVNEASLTAGKTFVSTQTILNSGLSPNPKLHFGNEETVAFNYSRLLKTKGIFGIRAELPVAIYPRMDLNTAYHGIPKDMGALFITPSVRVNIFSADNFTPWVSAGAGYGRFRYAQELNFPYGTYAGPSGSNTGVIQFGGGLDAWIFNRWGARLEVRDFYSGEPDLNALSGAHITTNRSRQHNYYVGIGVVHRF